RADPAQAVGRRDRVLTDEAVHHTRRLVEVDVDDEARARPLVVQQALAERIAAAARIGLLRVGPGIAHRAGGPDEDGIGAEPGDVVPRDELVVAAAAHHERDDLGAAGVDDDVAQLAELLCGVATQHGAADGVFLLDKRQAPPSSAARNSSTAAPKPTRSSRTK